MEKLGKEITSLLCEIYLKENRKGQKGLVFLDTIENGYNLLDNYEEFITTKDIKTFTEGSRNRKLEYYVLNFNKSSTRLDQNYYNFFESIQKIDIDWLGLSSGQKAYIDIFSLLYYTLKKIKTQNILICIDEGDLYLHPKWQADFFYKLINIVPEFRNANYQFILTSHSPFLVSDLPKQNLVFLSEDEEISNKIMKDENIQTLAGNIGELYIEAFFMEGNLISRFAADKINRIIHKINNKQKLDPQDKAIINCIGDDFIKIQIKNLLDD